MEAIEPAGAMAIPVYLTREAGAADVGAAFCSMVPHFVSGDSAERFAEQDPTRKVVGLAEPQNTAGKF